MIVENCKMVRFDVAVEVLVGKSLKKKLRRKRREFEFDVFFLEKIVFYGISLGFYVLVSFVCLFECLLIFLDNWFLV